MVELLNLIRRVLRTLHLDIKMIPEKLQELTLMMLFRVFPIDDPGNRLDLEKYDKRLLELLKEFLQPYIITTDSKE